MTALLIKESVNQTVDNMGFSNALAACFTIHQLNHSHWAELHDDRFETRADRVTMPPTAPSIRLCAAPLLSVVSVQSVPWRSVSVSARAHWVSSCWRRSAVTGRASGCSGASPRTLQAWKTALQYFPASLSLRLTHALTG